MKNTFAVILLAISGLIVVTASAQECPPFQNLYSWNESSGHNDIILSSNRAGDINNDGVTDFIFCAASLTPEPNRVYVYSGENGSLLHQLEIVGANEVCGFGDINEDGFDDFLVGTLADQVYEARICSGETGETLLVLSGEGGEDLFGMDISWAGDVNNDGYEDVIVGAQGGGGGLGRAYVFSGLTGSTLYTFTGEDQECGSFGSSVSGAGDVDSDGYGDLIVGAPYAQCQSNLDGLLSIPGRAYVFSGQFGTKLHTFTHELEDLEEGCYAYLGTAVSGVGDVNNNGYDDVAFMVRRGAVQYPASPNVVEIYDGDDLGNDPISPIRTACEDCQIVPQAGVGDIDGDFHEDYLTIDYEAQQVILHSGVDNSELFTFAVDLGSGARLYPYSLAMARDDPQGESRLIISGSGTLTGPQSFNPGRVDVYTCGCGDTGFQPNMNGWGFDNDNSNGVLWGTADYDHIDYSRPPYDPIYFHRKENSVFPSWEVYERVYGEDIYEHDGQGNRLTNYDGSYVVNHEAALHWRHNSVAFGGACLGFAGTALSFFDECPSCLDLNNELGEPGTLYAHEISDNEYRPRMLIQEYQTLERDPDRLFRGMPLGKSSPSETLRMCQAMFASQESDHRILKLWWPGAPSAHYVVPYKCEQHESEDGHWWVYVYDPNCPGDNQCRVRVNQGANNGAGEWYYQKCYGDDSAWKDGFLFLYESSSELAVNSAFNSSQGNSTRGTDLDSTSYILTYCGYANSTLIDGPLGSIGHVDSQVFDSLSNGMPVIPATESPQLPIGYLLPEGEWSCQFFGLQGADYEFSVFWDSAVVNYYCDSTTNDNNERFKVPDADGTLWVFNDDPDPKTYTYTLVQSPADSQMVVLVQDIIANANDSIRYSRTDQLALQLDNYGGPTTYDLNIRLVDTSGLKICYHEDIVLDGNCSQTIIPDWRPFGDSVMILTDPGMTGTYSDTTMFSNDYVPTCCMPPIRGNINYDPGDGIDISDLVYLVDYMFNGGPTPPCDDEADVNASGSLDISDLVYLVDYMFTGGPPPLACP